MCILTSILNRIVFYSNKASKQASKQASNNLIYFYLYKYLFPYIDLFFNCIFSYAVNLLFKFLKINYSNLLCGVKNVISL